MKCEETEEANKGESYGTNLNKLSLSKKDSTTSAFVNQKRCCNCKQSKCIKLYCECFANGVYCNPTCNCVDCWNNPNFEEQRKAAIQTTLEKNPNAFQPKISTPNFMETKKAELNPILGRHNKGCSCKKSGCMKKYCECFQAGIPCTELCKCMDCHNTKEYYDKLKGSKSIIAEPIKQEELGDSNIKFLLACGDEDQLTRLVSDGRDSGPSRKEPSLNQSAIEDFFRKLMTMVDTPIKDYIKNHENKRHLEEYVDQTRKKVKKDNDTGLPRGRSGSTINPNSEKNSQVIVKDDHIEEEEEKDKQNNRMQLDNDDLMCNDEDANELSNGLQHLDLLQKKAINVTGNVMDNKVDDLLTGNGHGHVVSHGIDVNRSEISKKLNETENGTENSNANGNKIWESAHETKKEKVDSMEEKGRVEAQKISFYKVKKDKILKDFITILRKYNE